jgi:hypothetical protein
MNARTERAVADVLLVLALVASFLTHEGGVLLHSLVSLVFTALALHHVKHNWRAYRRPSKRSKAVANRATAISLVMATVTGLVFWVAGGDDALAHGPLSVAATLSVLPHVWVHRRAVRRLIRRSSRNHWPTTV